MNNVWADSFSESLVRNRLIYVVRYCNLENENIFFSVDHEIQKRKRNRRKHSNNRVFKNLTWWSRWSCDVLVARKCGPDIFIISIFSLGWWMFYVQCQELGGLFSTLFSSSCGEVMATIRCRSIFSACNEVAGVALLTPTNFHAVKWEITINYLW